MTHHHLSWLLSLLLIVLFPPFIRSQYTIKDSYELEKALAQKDKNAVLNLVLRHTPPTDNLQRLRSSFEKNPFLSKALANFQYTDDELKAARAVISNDRQASWQFKTQEERYQQVRRLNNNRATNYVRSQRYSTNSSYDQLVSTATNVNFNRGFSASNWVAGLTDFIIERAQEELANAFLQTFKRKMKDPAKYAELQQLFPSTKEFLKENDLSTSGPIIQMAKGSFENDLTELSVNVPKLLRLAQYSEQQNSDKVVILTLLYEVLDMVYKGLEPDDIVVISEDRLHWQIWKLEQDNKKNYIEALTEHPKEKKGLVTKVGVLNKAIGEIKEDIARLKIFQQAYERELGTGRFNPYEDLDLIFIDGTAFLDENSSAKNIYNTINDMEQALLVAEEDLRNARQLELFKKGNSNLIKDAENALKRIRNWQPYKDLLDEHDRFQIAYTQNIIGKNIGNLKRIVNALNYSSFILYSFVTDDGKQHFASRSQVDSLFADNDRRQIFLGLLHQKFADKIPVKNLEVYVDRYYNLIDDLQKHKQTTATNPNAAPNADRYQTHLPAVRTTYDLLTTGLSVEVQGDTTILPTSEVKALESVADHTYDLSESTYNREYSASVYNASALMDFMLEEQKNQDSYKVVKADFIQYGIFIANVLQARTPAEVQQAIRMVAMPPGSSQAKKQGKFDISINSYFGLYGGQEILISPDITDPKKYSFGLTVPVGISMSAGLKEFGSISMFFPVFDLGAVAAFRLESGQAFNLPAFSLQNLAAPGAYLVYGFPDYPFSIAAGVQYGPQLRKVTRSGVNVESPAYRYSIALTVDIPLFNLYYKP